MPGDCPQAEREAMNMTTSTRSSINVLRVLGISAILGLVSAHAAHAATSSTPPNITGVWNIAEDPFAADVFAPDPPPPGGEPPLREPYATEYKAQLKRRAEGDEQGKPLPTPSSLCLPEGMPTIMGAHYALEFLQTSGQITVLAEFMGQTRRIYLGEPMPNPNDIELSFNGYSVGHWEGKTLVVTTVRIRPDVRFMEIPHSDQMKITERIHLTAPDHLQNDIVIEDPQAMTRPYRFSFQYKKEPRSYKIGEYVCENNKTVVGQDGTFDMKVEPQPGQKAP